MNHFHVGLFALGLVAVGPAHAGSLVTFPEVGAATPGCPIGVRVTYKRGSEVFGRTYYGGTTYPGVCAHRMTTAAGVRPSASISGLWFDNPMVAPQKAADAVLPVLIGKRTSTTFTGEGSDGLFLDEFSFVKEGKVDIDGASYDTKVHEFKEKDFKSNRTLWDFYCTWVTNPRDNQAPIFVGTEDAGYDVYQDPGLKAVKITFLPDQRGSSGAAPPK